MENFLLEGLRASGVKLTPQRRAICQWLANNDTHPSAASVYEALHEQLPGMSLATVYNTLTLLHELDLIHEVARAADGSVRYDPNTRPHLNLICTECGRILDQPVPTAHLETLHQIAGTSGFHIVDANIAVHGVCQQCQSQKG